MTDPKDGWKIATSTMANRKLGMVWKISVTRISSSSQRPPRYPAGTPISMPMNTATTVATTPTSSEACAPCTMPAAMLRPMESAPPAGGAGFFKRTQERRFGGIPGIDGIEPVGAQGHQHDGAQADQPDHGAGIGEISLDQ